MLFVDKVVWAIEISFQADVKGRESLWTTSSLIKLSLLQESTSADSCWPLIYTCVAALDKLPGTAAVIAHSDGLNMVATVAEPLDQQTFA